MRYEAPLAWGILLRRYQRFLADVRLGSGEVVHAHVPNSGRMTGCATPGMPCLVSAAAGPHRRLPWTLEQVAAGGVPVGVNTLRANRLAEEALGSGVLRLPGLATGWRLAREVAAGAGCRFDLCLTDEAGRTWVEVKNVTLVEEQTALFPDAVTERGAKHLRSLAGLVAAGDRCALVYVVQRGDATRVAANDRVDPAYVEALAAAMAAGVAVRAVQVVVSSNALVPWRTLPVLSGPTDAAPPR